MLVVFDQLSDNLLIVHQRNISVPRIQFLAVEVLRNRRGLNDGLRDKFRIVDDE